VAMDHPPATPPDVASPDGAARSGPRDQLAADNSFDALGVGDELGRLVRRDRLSGKDRDLDDERGQRAARAAGVTVAEREACGGHLRRQAVARADAAHRGGEVVQLLSRAHEVYDKLLPGTGVAGPIGRLAGD